MRRRAGISRHKNIAEEKEGALFAPATSAPHLTAHIRVREPWAGSSLPDALCPLLCRRLPLS
jgi:hypothetical protein